MEVVMGKQDYDSPYGFHLASLVTHFHAQGDPNRTSVTITRADAPDIRGNAYPTSSGILIVHELSGGMDVETFVAYEDVRGIARFCAKQTRY
jgi:hypothetical protein